MSDHRATKGWLCAFAATALLLSGCSDRTSNAAGKDSGSGDSGSGDSATSELLTQPTALPVTTALAEKPEEGLTVAYLYNGLDQSAAFLRGVKAGSKALGWTVKEFTYDPANPATLLSAATSAISAKPAALITNSLPAAAMDPIYSAASKAGVPIVDGVTSNPAKPGRYPILTAPVNTTGAAKMAAEQLVEDAKADGKIPKVVEVTVPQFADVLGPLAAAVKKSLSDCSGCTHDLLNVSLPDVLAGKGTSQIVSYLQAHPDVNYVFADAAQIDLGLPAALQAAGLTDVQRYGALPGPAQIGELQNGGTGAWATFPIEVYGWAMVDTVARVVTGDTSNPWSEAVLAYVLNESNAGDVDAKSPSFPTGYENMFKEMWQVG